MKTSWHERLNEVEVLLAEGHHKQAVQEAGGVLEQILRQLYGEVLSRLPSTEKKEVAESLARIGGQKPVEKLTLGALVGLFRDAKLFAKAKSVGLENPHVSAANFTPFVDTRNEAAHGGREPSSEEAAALAAQVKLYLTELGWLETRTNQAGPRSVSRTDRRPWTRRIVQAAGLLIGGAKVPYVNYGLVVAVHSD